MVSTEVLVLNAPRLAAGAMMLGLAVWVLATDFWSKVFRAFAVFLTLRGALNLLLPFATGNVASSNLNHWATTVPYFQIAVPFAALAFVTRLTDPEGTRRSSRPILWGLLATALVMELLYFLDHGHYFGHRSGGQNWLFLTISLGDLAYVAAAHALVRYGSERRFTIAAVGLLLFPVFAGGVELALFARAMETGRLLLYQTAESWFFVAIRFVAVVYAAFVLSRAPRSAIGRGGAVVTGVAFLTGLAWAPIYLIYSSTRGEPTAVEAWQFASVMNGLWTAAMPFAVGHALLRGHLPTRLRQLGPLAWVGAAGFLLLTGAMFLSIQGLRETGVLVGVMGLTLLMVLAVGNATAMEPDPDVSTSP